MPCICVREGIQKPRPSRTSPYTATQGERYSGRLIPRKTKARGCLGGEQRSCRPRLATATLHHPWRTGLLPKLFARPAKPGQYIQQGSRWYARPTMDMGKSGCPSLRGKNVSCRVGPASTSERARPTPWSRNASGGNNGGPAARSVLAGPTLPIYRSESYFATLSYFRPSSSARQQYQLATEE